MPVSIGTSFSATYSEGHLSEGRGVVLDEVVLAGVVLAETDHVGKGPRTLTI